jgi:hypothetical protein
MPTVKRLWLPTVLAAAKDRPTGYVDDVLARADRRGDLLLLSPRDYAHLCAKYRAHRSSSRLVNPGFPRSPGRRFFSHALLRLVDAGVSPIPCLLECARIAGDLPEGIDSKLDLLKRACGRLRLAFSRSRDGDRILMVAANRRSCLAIPRAGPILYCRMDGSKPVKCELIKPLSY